MRMIVVYESVFGNTHRIAAAIEHGARQYASTRLVSVGELASEDIASADALVLGGPTHAFSMSTPASRRDAVAWTRDPRRGLYLDAGVPTSGIREWLAAQSSLPGRFATFDTRAVSMRHFPGSAAKKADRELRFRGLSRMDSPMSFYVSSDNVLLPGEEERATAWGEKLARTSSASVAAR